LEDRRNAGENSCNSGDGTDQTGPILDVYDDDDDDDDDYDDSCLIVTTMKISNNNQDRQCTLM